MELSLDDPYENSDAFLGYNQPAIHPTVFLVIVGLLQPANNKPVAGLFQG